jgi:OmpA-OmpF porin, OOP family
MSRWCPMCRWWVVVPLLLGLSLLGTIGGCAIVEKDLTSRSQKLLDARGLTDVSLDFEYRTAKLRGPEAQRQAALEVVTLDGVRSGTYTATDAAPTAVATPTVDARVAFDGTRMVLTGEVGSNAQRTQLVDAATRAVGQGNVDDKLTVGEAGTSAALDGAVGQLAAVLGTAPGALSNARFDLVGLALTASGEGIAGKLAPVTSVLDAARATGLEVTNGIGNAPPAVATPPAPAPAVQKKLDELLRGTTIQFATASTDITPASKTILDRAAAVMRPALRGNPRLKVSVDGHTDDQGDAGRNQTLSEGRAAAVLDYLAAAGVPRGRLSAKGYGEDQPVASNRTDKGRLANRRIEFTVTGA